MALANDENTRGSPLKKTLNEIVPLCKTLGLAPEILLLHQRRVLESIANPPRYFPIADTCTISNTGILPLESLAVAATSYESAGVVALVPAAGAASRYVAPLESVSKAAQNRDPVALKAVLLNLLADGAKKWAVPAPLSQLLADPEQVHSLQDDDWKQLAGFGDMPKALYPCTMEGSTFLNWKIREHLAIGGLSGQVFVTPPSGKAAFLSGIKGSFKSHGDAYGVRFLEQGGQLSTLRFRPDGSPALDDKGHPSVVPAGHGALTRLFEDVQQETSGGSTLFIRNIDNLSGTGSLAVEASRAFLRAHTGILNSMRKIRTALQRRDLTQASASAELLLQVLPQHCKKSIATTDSSATNRPAATLWALQELLFHTGAKDLPHGLSELEALAWVYSRPFNLLGQVANSGKDVGGTPVFLAQNEPAKPAAASVGKSPLLARPRKICVELPHAIEQDARIYLGDPARATHFNPVFIAAEIPADPTWYDGGFNRINLFDENSDSGHPFWLVAKKMWRGETVYYHESLLSEVLGNSTLTNFIFVEIPRALFNPHKSLADSCDRHDSDWM